MGKTASNIRDNGLQRCTSTSTSTYQNLFTLLQKKEINDSVFKCHVEKLTFFHVSPISYRGVCALCILYTHHLFGTEFYKNIAFYRWWFFRFKQSMYVIFMCRCGFEIFVFYSSIHTSNNLMCESVRCAFSFYTLRL